MASDEPTSAKQGFVPSPRSRAAGSPPSRRRRDPGGEDDGRMLRHTQYRVKKSQVDGGTLHTGKYPKKEPKPRTLYALRPGRRIELARLGINRRSVSPPTQQPMTSAPASTKKHADPFSNLNTHLLLGETCPSVTNDLCVMITVAGRVLLEGSGRGRTAKPAHRCTSISSVLRWSSSCPSWVGGPVEGIGHQPRYVACRPSTAHQQGKGPGRDTRKARRICPFFIVQKTPLFSP